MVKLYQKQNQQIQGIGIVQNPQNNVGSQIASGLNSYAGKIQRAAEDNFALGKTQVINDITSQAYEIAPDDVAKFNELVEKGLQKSFAGLDDAVQTKIRASINTKLDSIRHKVVQNKLNRLDTENKERVISNGNSVLNGTGGVFETNNAIVDYLYQTSNSTGEAKTRNIEFGKTHIENNKRNFKQLEALTNLKDSNGNAYLGQRDYESLVKQGKENLTQTLKSKLYSLNAEQLKSFSENTLQDNKAMETVGIDFDEAEKIRKYATSRLKELDKNAEIEIKTQNQYDAARMVIGYDDDKAKELVNAGYMSNSMRKELKEASEFNFNEMSVKDTDINVISQFALLKDVANSKDDGSEDYNNKLLGLMADTTKSLNEFVKANGTEKSIFEATTNSLFNVATNKEIQEVVQPVYDENTFLGETLKAYGDSHFQKTYAKMQADKITSDWDNKVLREITSKGLMQISLMASQLNNENLTTDEKDVIKNNIKSYRERLNKDMIKAKYSKQFPLDYLNELENKHNSGQDVMFMKNGITYLFQGFSNNDIMVKIVK